MDNHHYLVIIVAAILAASCSPRIIERVRVERDTLVTHHRDSIQVRDSVYVREWIKGDTVFVDRYRDRFVYRDRWRDSVVTKVDSVAIERTIEVKIEKPLSWWKKAKIAAFWWLVVLSVSLAGAMVLLTKFK